QEHAVADLGEHVRQPDRRGGLARARLQVGQGQAQRRHPGIMPVPSALPQTVAACWQAVRASELQATGSRTDLPPGRLVTQYCSIYGITASSPAARRSSVPNTGPPDVASAGGAVGMRAATCLCVPAEQQCVGARTAVTAGICVTPGEVSHSLWTA